MANVDERDHAAKLAVLVVIAFNHFAPAGFFRFRNLREAIPWQVDEVGPFGLEEIDGRRFARRGRNLRKLFAIEQLVHKRRLANVGTADERNLGARGRGQLLGSAIGCGEFHVVVVHRFRHAISLLVTPPILPYEAAFFARLRFFAHIRHKFFDVGLTSAYSFTLPCCMGQAAVHRSKRRLQVSSTRETGAGSHAKGSEAANPHVDAAEC